MRGRSWRPGRPVAVLGVALGALCASACGDGIRDRITLMPWDRLRGSPGALTVDDAARGMRDAGLNTAGFVKPEDLDTCRKKRIGERTRRLAGDPPRRIQAVGEHVVFIREQRRLAGSLVFDVIVAALAQRVPKKRRALREIDRVFGAFAPKIPGRPRADHLFRVLRSDTQRLTVLAPDYNSGNEVLAIQAAGATSLRAIAAELNERSIPTARGEGTWSAAQVARVLDRL